MLEKVAKMLWMLVLAPAIAPARKVMVPTLRSPVTVR